MPILRHNEGRAAHILARIEDRKSNATFGSIFVFDSGGLSQSSIWHQEVLGAAIKLPYCSSGNDYSPESGCNGEKS